MTAQGKYLDKPPVKFEALLAVLSQITEPEEAFCQEFLDRDVVVEAMTQKAALLDIIGMGKAWFPLSQMRKMDSTLYVKTWILEKNGCA